MEEKEIIELWTSGLSKYKVAEIYKRRYNQYIKIVRLEVRNRHSGRFISSYEALNKVEYTILEYLRKEIKER